MERKDNQQNICNETLFNDLFREHSDNLFKFLYYKYGEEHNPADIVQEAFIKLWDNCQKVVLEKARGFLFTVANNLMLSTLSRKKTADKYRAELEDDKTGQDPEYLLQEKEYKAQLDAAIAGLTEEQRVTLLLNRIEGKKHQEIADMLGISRKAVEKRIYTAIAKIREQVDFFK
jgi:RNA polymerase sigma factor (sigma-70 family)